MTTEQNTGEAFKNADFVMESAGQPVHQITQEYPGTFEHAGPSTWETLGEQVQSSDPVVLGGEAARNAGENIRHTVQETFDAVYSTGEDALKKTSDALKTVGEVVTDKTKVALEVTAHTVQSATETAKEATQAVANMLYAGKDTVVDVSKAAYDTTTSTVSGIAHATADTVSSATEAVANTSRAVYETTGEALKATGEAVTHGTKAALDTTASALSSATETVANTSRAVYETTTEAVSGIAHATADTVSSATEAVANTSRAVYETTGEALKSTGEVLHQAGTAVVNFTEGLIGQEADKVKQVWLK